MNQERSRRANQASNGRRVCVFTTSHDATDARVFHREAVALADAGYDVTLFTPFGPSRVEDGVRIRSFEGIDTDEGQPPLPGVKTRLHWALDLLGELYDTDYDLYHFHDAELLPTGAALSVLTNGKVVYDVHENVGNVLQHKELLPEPVRPAMAGAISLVERGLAHATDGVVAASTDIAERFESHPEVITVTNYPQVKWAERAADWGVVPKVKGGIDGEDASEPEGDEPVRFVYCGLLSEDRGIPRLIDAIEEVPEQRAVELVIGGKYETDADEELIERKGRYSERTSLVGWQDTLADVFGLLYGADVGMMVFAPDPNKTRAAHRSNKLFWYMAAALPIVVSDIGNWTEVVEGADCGIPVDPLDTEEIAAVMSDLAADPGKRRELGAAGHEAALTTYNWEVQCDRLFDLYERLLGPLPAKIEL
jgi:glycosyltransferase involved in cell wall biosynthesis